MADPSRLREPGRFSEIERLVQDSVFHPSPCRRLRERVLQSAARAEHRQTVWQRFLVGSSAVLGILLVAVVAIRIATHRPTVLPVSSDAGPVRVQVYSPGHVREFTVAPSRDMGAPGTSLGEAYFKHAGGSSEGIPADHTQTSGQK